MKNSILIVDDEFGIREFLYELFKGEYDLFLAEDGEKAIQILSREICDVALIDLRMPGVSGVDVLNYIKTNNVKVIPIVVTADRDIEHAVEAMKMDAYDYITKPIDFQKLKIIVKNAINKKDLEEKLDILEKDIAPNYSFPNIISKSKAMKIVFATMDSVLNNDATVLIFGESGTGKELIARGIHYNGNRMTKPFIPVDCAAIPDTLIETELFGYEKGAFTGANKATKGKFELADGGTIFLDEVSNISMESQAKLLRVIQEREFIRIGGERTISIDVRIICASNKDLMGMVKHSEFREDLYYRLNVIPINIPPLRNREEDIPLLINHFLEKYNKVYNKGISISKDAISLLLEYNWPGNIRELTNLMNRLVLIATGDQITAANLPDNIRNKETSTVAVPPSGDADMSLEDLEKAHIEKLLMKYDYNISIVSEILGVTRKTLYAKMDRYNIKKSFN